MRILAIETSCDESAICLLEADGAFGPDFRFRVIGNALASQAALHAQFGGVFPNLAKREHAKALVPLLTQVLQQWGEENTKSSQNIEIVSPYIREELAREPELLEQLLPFLASHGKPDIDCIAVTHGPGLEPALWVGINFAKALARAWDIPIVPVNHMEGHIVMSMTLVDRLPSTVDRAESLSVSGKLSTVNFPVLALLISGGHTELVLSREFQKYERIGQTRDDAAGEAFDKVARLLGLPYPGGPEISRLAAAAREQGIKAEFSFTRPMLHEPNYDFSFSGLKTAVRRTVESLRQGPALPDEIKLQIAREFEETVADVLVQKTMRAVEEYGVQTVVVGGGVSANAFIRAELKRALEAADASATLLVPPPALATDNALMIALAGYFRAINGKFAEADTIRADGNLRL